MKRVGNILIVVGICLLVWFGYTQFKQGAMQQNALDEAWLLVEGDQQLVGETEPMEAQNEEPVTLSAPDTQTDHSYEAYESFDIPEQQAFAILDIEALDRSLPIVDGTQPEDLDKGVGHVRQTSLPGGGEQIVLSGHRDTVFRDFGSLELGDTFLVHMPYGSFHYEIKETEIVDAEDRTVIRDMGEEVLVVTTCYPFHYINQAPERFVIYAYPV
ncbi:class D sortase [Alkalicoccobacillus porphyridii]|uniref:Class D sortase n=1 Tax=Alkalicoccobacillus porphyridii TaxID=2597270 RepID=A0A554A4A4_9BACI|nr:class D sortase [Alkalicoccobacillus porphyridii]TSB48524.1 class D sortase [Alkalicoccobacillus porphyridii]